MVLEISTLENINGLVKRRLDFHKGSGNTLYLSNGESAWKPGFCGVGFLEVHQLDPDRLREGTKYRIEDSWVRGESPFVSETQARLILGYDSFSVADEWDIPAMLEASRDGIVKANAYFLGETRNATPYRESEGASATVPVAYFWISKEQFLNDGLNKGDQRFEDLRGAVARELESAVF